jgi:hypothetical protein
MCAIAQSGGTRFACRLSFIRIVHLLAIWLLTFAVWHFVAFQIDIHLQSIEHATNPPVDVTRWCQSVIGDLNQQIAIDQGAQQALENTPKDSPDYSRRWSDAQKTRSQLDTMIGRCVGRQLQRCGTPLRPQRR